MSESAKYKGQTIKVGTCEDMYYLRADQAHLVQPAPNSVNVVRDREHIRFRFPFPWEDGIEPGKFENFKLGLHVSGIKAPDEVEHGIVQFTAREGYNVCLPCPEGPKQIEGVRVHRNGYRGAVLISQQRYIGNRLVLVCECGGCGYKYRYETLEQVQPVLDACIKQAEADENYHPKDPNRAKMWREIERRIRAGYELEVNIVPDLELVTQ